MLILRLAIIASLLGSFLGEATKFSVTGPVLTVTLREPLERKDSNEGNNNNNKWLDLGSLCPNLQWSVSSDDPPLPNWFPSFKSCHATLGYRYDDIKTAPSFLEGNARFANDFGELTLQPTFQVKQRKASMVVQATKGASYTVARFTTKGKRVLEFLRGSYAVSLPFASISGVRVTPSYDFVTCNLSILVEGVTGSARTKAILNLQYQEPTLTVVHALDER
jgi:hypothetical protein